MYVVITNEYWPDTGGVGRYTYTLSHSLSKYKEIEVLTHLGHSAEENDQLKVVPIFKRRIGSFVNFFISIVSLSKYIKNINNAQYIFSSYGVILIGVFCPFVAKEKYIVVFHGTEINRLDKLKKRNFLLKYLINNFLINSKKIVCISNTVNNIYKYKFSDIYKNAQSVVIYNALDSSFICNYPSPKRQVLDDKGINIVTVGRLDHRKRVDLLIQSLSKVTRYCTLHIVGDGPTKEFLEDEAIKLPKHITVKFHGRVSDKGLDKLYAEADLYVACAGRYKTTIEGFGLTIIEAASFGVPVLAFDVDGAGEVARMIKASVVDSRIADISKFIEEFSIELYRDQLKPKEVLALFSPERQARDFNELLQ